MSEAINTTSGAFSKERFRIQFELLESRMNGMKGSHFHTLRKDAMTSFEEIGFPDRKHEDWKYVSVRNLINNSLSPAPHQRVDKAPDPLPGEQVFNRLVFINGSFSAEHSNVIDQGEGVTISSLTEAQNSNPEKLKPYFNSLTADKKQGFPALNTAFYQDGVFVHLGEDKSPAHPVLVEEWHTNLEEAMVFPRNLIITEAGSTVRCYHLVRALSGNDCIRGNAVTEIFIGAKATVDWIELQDRKEALSMEYIHTLEVDVKDHAHFNCWTISLAGELVRNDLRVRLNGPHAETDLRGLYLPMGEDVMDNHLRIDHAVPDCLSNQLYKGIADDKGKGVFNGQIHVWKDAQRTNAYQSNKNVVLSDTASINTKPQLEIFADDVKCSHGATSGQLDKEAMFYLQARGIPGGEARTLLLHAFAADVLEGLGDNPFHHYIDERLRAKLVLK